jgi:hypothetical protein
MLNCCRGSIIMATHKDTYQLAEWMVRHILTIFVPLIIIYRFEGRIAPCNVNSHPPIVCCSAVQSAVSKRSSGYREEKIAATSTAFAITSNNVLPVKYRSLPTEGRKIEIWQSMQ